MSLTKLDRPQTGILTGKTVWFDFNLTQRLIYRRAILHSLRSEPDCARSVN
ncbi:MAG TPA: hypothetical protein VGN95_15230 [Pyrinomonadaceae bacterium]|nr:hypothetical protein [Pyrinomonadaceae bacterium]